MSQMLNNAIRRIKYRLANDPSSINFLDVKQVVNYAEYAMKLLSRRADQIAELKAQVAHAGSIQEAANRINEKVLQLNLHVSELEAERDALKAMISCVSDHSRIINTPCPDCGYAPGGTDDV